MNNAYNIQDKAVQVLMEELLVLTETELFNLSEQYQAMKHTVEQYSKELQMMNAEAERLEKRHSQIERILGAVYEH